MFKRPAALVLGFLLAVLLLSAECFPAGPGQTTDTVFMVSPDDFQYNVETAASNVFQHQLTDPKEQTRRAVAQFNHMVKTLEEEGITVIHVPSRKDVITPDAVFPNNWFSTHRDREGQNVLVVYPMLTPNRRAEERVGLLLKKFKEHGFPVSWLVDLTGYEKENRALEGTGSMVLDRVQKVAFASLSPRTDQGILQDFCGQMGYRAVTFDSYDGHGKLVYHTNVMMSLGVGFAVICAEAIKDPAQRARVLARLKGLGKKVMEIHLGQMENMCVNILELRTRNSGGIIVMSRRAHDHFTAAQRTELAGFGKLVAVDIHTIEDIGGGSARCMMAEVF